MYFVNSFQALCLLCLAMTILIVAGDSSSHVQYICEGNDMELRLNHTARSLSDVSLSFKGKAIAEANDVQSMEWDPGRSETYTRRLFLNNPENLTITLKNLTTMDTGMYIADVTTEKGKIGTIQENIYVSVAPVVKGEFTMNDTGNIFTCGHFSDFGKPPVTFKWNVSYSTNHSIRLSTKEPLNCSVVGPAVETCGMNLTAVYQGGGQATGTSTVTFVLGVLPTIAFLLSSLY